MTRRVLDDRITRDYFLGELSYGHALSRALRDVVIARDGVFVAVLLVSAPTGDLYDFRTARGGPGEAGLFVERLFRFLTASDSHTLLVEAALLEPSDLLEPHSISARLLPGQDGAYAVADRASSRAEVDGAFGFCLESPPGTGVVVRAPVASALLTNADLIEACAHAEAIFLGAYDGDGFLVWVADPNSEIAQLLQTEAERTADVR